MLVKERFDVEQKLEPPAASDRKNNLNVALESFWVFERAQGPRSQAFLFPFNFIFNLPQIQTSSSEIIEREIRDESCVTVELNSPRKQTRLHSFMVVMNLLFSLSPTHWDFSHLKLTYDHQQDWWVSFFVFSLFCPFYSDPLLLMLLSLLSYELSACRFLSLFLSLTLSSRPHCVSCHSVPVSFVLVLLMHATQAKACWKQGGWLMWALYFEES